MGTDMSKNSGETKGMGAFKLIFAYLCYDGDIPQGKLT
jgi:hypothetical protein